MVELLYGRVNLDPESMAAYRHECEPVYTKEEMNEVLAAVSKMFGKQILVNDGTLLVSIEDYNKFADIANEIVNK